MQEAKLVDRGTGLVPEGEGWFVVNAAEAAWHASKGSGRYCVFEDPEAKFEEYGINIHVVDPGEPNALYHREEAQEDFLILSGECILVVEGEERRLRAWDFVHCPAWTEHVFVGAGDGPCAILMTGSRRPDAGLVYPVSDVALRHGAGVEVETRDAREAYAGRPIFSPAPYRPGDLPRT
jgi:uncharacterized cupin superfamily protein